MQCEELLAMFSTKTRPNSLGRPLFNPLLLGKFMDATLASMKADYTEVPGVGEGWKVTSFVDVTRGDVSEACASLSRWEVFQLSSKPDPK